MHWKRCLQNTCIGHFDLALKCYSLVYRELSRITCRSAWRRWNTAADPGLAWYPTNLVPGSATKSTRITLRGSCLSDSSTETKDPPSPSSLEATGLEVTQQWYPKSRTTRLFVRHFVFRHQGTYQSFPLMTYLRGIHRPLSHHEKYSFRF